MQHEFITGDCLTILKGMPDKSVDLVITSPPYEDARTYGIGFSLKGQEFVDWCFERYMECHRVSRGLVAWVIEGKTKNFRYSSTPILLHADLHRAGVGMRHPVAFHRVGIPGSGGPDWLRNDWEFILCASHGKLPWSDNTACGTSPKFDPGGEPSNRTKNGERVSAMRDNATEPKALAFKAGLMPVGSKLHTKNDGSGMRVQCYVPPSKANPGNALESVVTASVFAELLARATGEQSDWSHHTVGGWRMGHPLAHKNEAPFPLTLAEFFVRSFCPPGGLVLDPFGGSGSVAHAAELNGRRSISIDIRESQTALQQERLDSVTSVSPCLRG